MRVLRSMFRGISRIKAKKGNSQTMMRLILILIVVGLMAYAAWRVFRF